MYFYQNTLEIFDFCTQTCLKITMKVDKLLHESIWFLRFLPETSWYLLKKGDSSTFQARNVLYLLLFLFGAKCLQELLCLSQNKDRNKSTSETDQSKGKACITHLLSGYIKWEILSPEKPNWVVFQERTTFLSCTNVAVNHSD